jgi:hypothetical protein
MRLTHTIQSTLNSVTDGDDTTDSGANRSDRINVCITAESHMSVMSINAHAHVMLPLTPVRAARDRLLRAIQHIRLSKQRLLRVGMLVGAGERRRFFFTRKSGHCKMCKWWSTISIDPMHRISFWLLLHRGKLNFLNVKNLNVCVFRSADDARPVGVQLLSNGNHVKIISMGDTVPDNLSFLNGAGSPNLSIGPNVTDVQWQRIITYALCDSWVIHKWVD